MHDMWRKILLPPGLAKKCAVQLAYAIGIAQPISIYINTFGTGNVSDEIIAADINEIFRFDPEGND